MESQLLSLSKIFTERIFRIPDYQRGYAWNEKQVKDFWNDLYQLPHDRNHYVGVVTMENVPLDKSNKWEDDNWIIDSKSYSPYYIVDGQQRLTTAIILIQSILESIDGNSKINFTSKEEIKKKFIFESKDEGISKSFLFGYEKDNPSHEYLKVKILNEAPTTNFTLQETIYTYNLEKAKSFFKETLNTLTLNEIEFIYKKLTQNFLFNFYTISSDIDVYMAFETMNNRGKPLSYLELLKNRLIYLSTKFTEIDIYERESLRKNINECWKDIYKYLGMNKLKPLKDDDFLSNHFVLYFWKEIKSPNKIGELENHFFYMRRLRNTHYSQSYLLDTKFTVKNTKSKDEDRITIQYINNYVGSLQKSVLYWNYIHNPNQSHYNDDIKKILSRINRTHYEEHFLLIMVFLLKVNDENKILYFLELMEKLSFLQLLSNGLVNRYAGINIELSEKLFWDLISVEEVIKKVTEYVNKLTTDTDLKNSVKIKFNKDGFYNWPGIKYLLFEYEEHLKFMAKTDRSKILWEEFNSRDFESIEHIYPQTPRSKYWQKSFGGFSAKEKRSLKDSLGNLVPISKSKNSSLSNKSFPEKIGNSNTMVGFKYGSYSEMELCDYDEWTPTQIIERGLKLINFMEKRWNYKIGSGSKEDKMEFLGLSFLNKKKR